MSEPREHAIKRMHMRSMRRGIKEMDLILSAYARAELDSMSDQDLALYDALLNENDQDLYTWVTGQVPAPREYSQMIASISQVFQK
ncbi:MAG: succinate dehydrogenase assembly factor 2 [Pseudomonadota bacterium]